MSTTLKFRSDNANARAQAPHNRVRLARLATAVAIPALVLSGCYVIPVGPDGNPVYAVGVPAVTPSGAPVVVQSGPRAAELNVRQTISQTRRAC